MPNTIDTTSEQSSREPSDVVRYWTNEIAAAKKREQDFRKKGEEIIEKYEGKKPTPFNILYSNTETMAPALYSATPIPVVQRRFKDEDPLGKAAAQAGQRVLAFLLDTNLDNYDTFDDAMKAAVANALLPGRGDTVVKYDAELGEVAGKAEGEAATPYTKSEIVCCDSKPWNRVLYGYAKKWSKVPWIAYEEYIDKDEATRLFGDKIAKQLVYTDAEPKEGQEEAKAQAAEPNQGERKTCLIYQIWDKDGGRKVKYFSSQYKDGLLKEEEDPLGLSGFFNCPKPLQFVEKTYSLVPTALYALYEQQAEELNEITRRIKNIVKAIKARGLYDGELGGDLKALMDADDNELIPADKGSSLAAEKGLDNAIWFMPVDKLIIVLRELYGAREQCKQVIYEITGISDILRGSTKASETLGAQEIKTQWGTLRLKNKQKEVARYARDLLRMMLEIAATKFSEETWAKMTGLPFLLSAKFNELTQLKAVLEQQVAQMQAMQPPPMPGQPPQQMPPPPQAQELQQVVQQLQTPQWAQVLDMLRDDLQRAYRIDIETNSTVEPEAADDHKNINEMMTVLGQLLNGLTPLVVSGAMPFDVVRSLLLVIARRYRFGAEIEDHIKAMQPPKPPDDGKGAEAVQKEKEMAGKELEMQKKQAENDLKMKAMDGDMAMKQKEMDLQMREAQLKVDQDVFKMKQQAAQEQLALRDQAYQLKTGADDKVRQVKDQHSVREQQIAKQSDSKVAQGMTAIQKATQQVQQLASALDAIQKQAGDTQQLLGELLKVAKAPRIKRAIRGKDNRIERVEEEVQV